MGKEQLENWIQMKLDAIRDDMAAGNLESAKERLLGIPMHAGPNSRFAEEIGHLYLQLDYPEMAGRYWYFVEHKTPEMISACEKFDRSFGDNPFIMYPALGWKGLFKKDSFGYQKFEELDGRAAEIRKQNELPWSSRPTLRDRIHLHRL